MQVRYLALILNIPYNLNRERKSSIFYCDFVATNFPIGFSIDFNAKQSLEARNVQVSTGRKVLVVFQYGNV